MRLWYLHHYAGGPGIGPSYRPYYLARAWQRQGHSATVFVASRHHLLIPDELPPETVVDGVRYIAVETRRYQSSGVGRLLNIMDFCRGLYRVSHRVNGDLSPPDAIIVSSPHPFAVYPGRALARQLGAKLAFEIRDIWPLSITEILGTPWWHPFVQICAATERYAYRHADLISSVLPRANEHVAACGFAEKPFVWLPNGVGESSSAGIDPSSAAGLRALAAIETWREKGKIIVVHAGSMGPPNGLVSLIEALATEDPRTLAARLGVLLVGSGPLEQELRQRVAETGIDVVIAGQVPKEELPQLLARCDVGYAGLNNIETLYRYGVSLNKFADYMLAGLAVLLPIAPCGDPVSEAGAGLACAVRSPEDMRSALWSLVELPESERREMGARGKRYMQENYDYERIAQRYIDALKSCGAGDR